MLGLIVSLLLQGAPPPSSSPPSPNEPSLVATPDWIRRPSARDFANHYPIAALRKGIAGRAVMSCAVESTGTLSNCKITEEYPADLGFGDSTLKMAPYFRMRPQTKDGVPIASGTIRIPIRFVLPGESSTDAYTAMMTCYGQAAAASERDPANAELLSAYAFFAAQSAIRGGEAKTRPSAFEAGLLAARLSADNGGPAPSLGNPGLSECLDMFRKNRPKRPS